MFLYVSQVWHSRLQAASSNKTGLLTASEFGNPVRPWGLRSFLVWVLRMISFAKAVQVYKKSGTHAGLTFSFLLVHFSASTCKGKTPRNMSILWFLDSSPTAGCDTLTGSDVVWGDSRSSWGGSAWSADKPNQAWQREIFTYRVSIPWQTWLMISDRRIIKCIHIHKRSTQILYIYCTFAS